MPSYLSNDELIKIGFKSIGKDCQISRYARFYGASRIEIGNNVRIDDYCVLSAGDGGIQIGNYVLLTVGVTMQGTGKIEVKDFAGFAAKVTIYSTTDDYCGQGMSSAAVPLKYRNPITGDVIIGRGVVVGSNSVILPGVTLNDYCSVGALSLVMRDCKSFWVYFGIPAKKLKPRDKEMINVEKKFLTDSE